VDPWDPACGGDVYALEASGGYVYLGGDFSIINGVPRSNLAAFEPTAGSLLSWNPATNATVDALTVSGTTVYIGGQFTQVNGTTRNRAASVDAQTGALTGFNPNVNVDFPTTVKVFVVAGSLVYMGGSFETVRGVPRGGLAAVNATTGTLSSWDPQVNGSVYTLAYVPGTPFGNAILAIGGQFTFAGGQPRNNFAIVDPTTGLAGATNPSPNGSVQSMVLIPTPLGGFNQIYLGGTFTTIGGQARSGIAEVIAFGNIASWAPNANAAVYSMAVVGNTVYAGGNFTSIGGQPRNHIAAIDAGTGAAATWDPSAVGGVPPGVVYALLKLGATTYAGGSFTTIAGTPQAYFAGILDGYITGVESDPSSEATPNAPLARLWQNYPNPFNPSTTVRYSLREAGPVWLGVFDVQGRMVAKLVDKPMLAGEHTVRWDGRTDQGTPAASGVYFYRLTTGSGYRQSRRMMMLK
jgi:hypothetical protein